MAALELGFITLDRFIELTRETLATMDVLPRVHGHFLNWYDTETLEALSPHFISTVDSGNLVVCLWTLKQACLEHRDPEHKQALEEIAEQASRFAQEMDFGMLWVPKRKVMSIGYDVDTSALHPSTYDLLASEARMAVFVSIALGQIPVEAWFHLGRSHAAAAGSRVLLSWSGTAFEYLLPALWMKHYEGTLLEASLRTVVKAQRRSAKGGRPWGASECAYGESEYGACGVAGLALDKDAFTGPVTAPYAAMLALNVAPKQVTRNLKKMERLGWMSDYGFYEAIDYTGAEPKVIRSWMAHHQGMSLLALTNRLMRDRFQDLFHAEERVEATERLLHEKLPPGVTLAVA